MENQHKKISGYRDLSQDEIDAINRVKQAEIDLGALWRDVRGLDSSDPRWAQVAKTHFEEGFSALVRSIAKPEGRF
jgi:hypothetical protein